MMDVYGWRDAPKAQFAVLGDPVAHSLSPAMHHAAYKALSLPYRYVAIRVPPDEITLALDHLAGRGYVGVNVTLPHKEAAFKWAKEPDAFVQRVRSANALRLANRAAVNTDAPGFIDTLDGLGIRPPAEVLLLGAGGSARALSAVLEDAGFSVKVWNRTKEKAKKMVENLGLKAQVLKTADPGGASLVVNATSASLQGEALPVDWSRANRRAIAYDLAYGPELTPFLLQAGLAGLKVVDGLEMLVRQGARSFQWWLGLEAPVDAMRRAVKCAS